MGKKNEEKKEKRIELSRLNKNMVTINNGVLKYKRVEVTYKPFTEDMKRQIGKLIYDAYNSLSEPIKLSKLPVNLIAQVKKYIGVADTMAIGAHILHEIENVECYVGLYFHNLYVGRPEHFKQGKEDSSASLDSVDTTDFAGLPKV